LIGFVGFPILLFIFIIICGFRFRNAGDSVNVSNMRQNQQTFIRRTYQPTTISDTFEEMRSHRPRIQSVHYCPPPAYDKIALDLPPSYDSIQK
jgi:hypothetical protein